MNSYLVTLAPVGPRPVMSLKQATFQVEARSEDSAMDTAFERAFAEHPELGAFYVEDIQEVA